MILPRDQDKLSSGYLSHELEFKKYIFKKGKTTIYSCYRHIFQNCHFYPGAVIRFQESQVAIFDDCIFEDGSVVHSAMMKVVRFTGSTVYHPLLFTDPVLYLNIVRTSLRDPFHLSPKCQGLYIHGKNTKGVLELGPHSLDGLPLRTHLVYRGICTSLDSLECITVALLRYPRLIIDPTELKDEWIEINKIQKHQSRHGISVIFVLLKVLPRDLIRGVFVDFLV